MKRGRGKVMLPILLEAVFFDFPPQGGAADTELPGGVHATAALDLEGFPDEIPLQSEQG